MPDISFDEASGIKTVQEIVTKADGKKVRVTKKIKVNPEHVELEIRVARRKV